MSQLPAEDDVELESLLKQLLGSVNDRISGAPSLECAEEILLHLEETDKNFHNYDFVKYLRQYIENSLASVVEEETKTLTRRDAGQHSIGSGHDNLIHTVTRKTRESAEYLQTVQSLKNSMIVVVESLVNKLEEDQLKKEEMIREKQHCQSNSQYNDNCSDSDSSLNQSYAFIRQEQLQALADKLDSSRPKQVRWEALQALCCAPPSDVLSCESWSSLRRNLCAALSDPDLGDNVLQFFAKSFSSSPLSVTREIYTSLARSVQSSFVSLKISFPSGSASVDISRPEISRLVNQMRLLNDFQKEVTTFWIRHPEKYMEEVIESTYSLLSSNHDHCPQRAEKTLEPVHLLALLDIKATWFKKWMHGYYSRTVVLRLLERKYKSLVVAALQQCLRFNESSLRFQSEATALWSAELHDTSLAQGTVYTGRELEYAFFVHSLCLLGKVLIYTHGRRLFPIQAVKHKEPVSLTQLVVVLINIMYQHPGPLPSDGVQTDSLSPSSLVMEVLWALCERAESAAECLHQDLVMEKLLGPVTALLTGQQVHLKSPAATLTLIADVLARIANTDRGLALFLREKNVVVARGERTFATQVIVQFTLRLLADDLFPLRDSDQSRSLCGAFIFVCRQMYNTCEGLQILRPLGLHSAIAAAWQKIRSLSERVPTPVPGATSGACGDEQQCMLQWEETLLDALLNFAATPKGLLLLQQTGAMDECISYMFSRSTKKLQVSRCEKFGYGVMVTQVAVTGPGVAALHSSGFIRELILELWSTLECSSEDVRVVRAKPTPMEPIDRSCLKSFLSLVNLLSSSQSVWKLLGRQPLANKAEYTLREMPTSVPDLMDRLIAVNSDAKMNSLFHFEQSHTFGLRLLSVICCHLDSYLLLESQYNISSLLLHSQSENVTQLDANDGEFIIDSLSVERNHVLVRVGLLGGPSERKLPARALQEGEDPYPWPMFSSYPPPDFYMLEQQEKHFSSQVHMESEIEAILASCKDFRNEESWMETCRRQYVKVMVSCPTVLTGKLLADLLDKVIAHQSSSSAECFFTSLPYKAEKYVEGTSLSSVEQLGVNACHRYGSFLKILKEDSLSDLTLLVKHIKLFLSTQRVKATSDLSPEQDAYPGHDWLLSTVFLIMAGDMERSRRFLLKLSSLLVSAFIWPARIHASVHMCVKIAESGITPLYWCTAHYVEMLLKAEVPLVYSAFRMSGFTPSQMCLHWLTQCFWNYLDWTEICHYVSTCVILGPDYQVYTCVAIFKHLQPDILQRTQSQELQVFLKEEPIQGFRISSYLEFMEGLKRSHRNLVLSDMTSIKNPVE